MRALLPCAAALVAASACAPALVPLPAPAPAPAAVATVAVPDSAVAFPHGDAVGKSPAPAPVVVSVSPADVSKEALAVFGEPVPPPSHALAVTKDGDEPSAVWDIDVHSFEDQARVELWVRRFSGEARESFASQVQRGVPYDSMVRAKLREGGIPEDMVYLALIESGFDVHAYSRAAAVGMWQFMASTARDIGLRVDWWIDERRDPVRSTDAAVRFLNDLRRQFGSLYLAAAAYNGGPTRIARGLTRFADDLEGTTGDSLFFALADRDVLRPETRDYVPKLIAAALVAKEPERYGIRLRAAPPFAYDSVRVPGATPIAAVAHAAGVPLARVRELNPHILRGMTPRGKPMFVRLPVGHAEGFEPAFAGLGGDERSAGRHVKTKKGETLASIARREGGLTARTIAWYNPVLITTKKGTLRAGQELFIPSRDVAAGARDVPDPGVERFPARRGSARTHVVRRGESLSLIARKNGTTVKALMRLNRLRQPLIRAGQELLVTNGTPSPRKGSRSAKVPKPKMKPTPPRKAKRSA